MGAQLVAGQRSGTRLGFGLRAMCRFGSHVKPMDIGVAGEADGYRPFIGDC